MERISYFRIFGFLAFAGSAFLSAVFHYPVFTVGWFVVMIIFMSLLKNEDSELNVLAFTALAYIPLGLISLLDSYTNKTPPPRDISEFAYLLMIIFVIELILAMFWIIKNTR